LPEGLGRALIAAGLETVGQTYERAMLDPDSILTLPEVGARNFDQLKETLERILLDLRADQKAEEEQAAAEKAAQEAAAAEEAAAVEEVAAAEEVPQPAPGTAVESAVEPLVEGAVPEETPATEPVVAEAPATAAVVEGEEEEEEEEDEEEKSTKKKKKKSKLKAVVEFDPETGMTVARRKHKPGRTKDWMEGGGLDVE
jgi:chemotaxis protein histidine kinase CheA